MMLPGPFPVPREMSPMARFRSLPVIALCGPDAAMAAELPPTRPDADLSYAYDLLDHLTNENSGATPTGAYAYDPNGNITSDGLHSYGYDLWGRMVSVDGGGNAS